MSSKNKNLISFLPGFSGLPPQTKNPLLNRFSNDGFDIISIKYRNFGFGDIHDTAGRAQRVLSSVRDYYDHICVIGHSMGGLVARDIDDSLYDSYVSIASPHRGIQAPMRANYVSSVRQMMRGSKFIEELPWPSCPSLNVTGQFDALVSAKASTPTLEFDNVKIPWATHLTVLTSQRTYGEIYSWLVYKILESSGESAEGFYSEIKL